MQTRIGVIGGSGLYDIAGLLDAAWQSVDTPWGAPSDQILTGTLAGTPMAFLPRHGRGHVHAPGTVPYRANIDALKRLGVTDIVSVSACGSFREDLAPGDFVLVDQYIDRTIGRERSFFGAGCVAHVSLAHPTCRRLSAACIVAAGAEGITTHATEGATFDELTTTFTGVLVVVAPLSSVALAVRLLPVPGTLMVCGLRSDSCWSSARCRRSARRRCCTCWSRSRL